jgi:hypothetical protein
MFIVGFRFYEETKASMHCNQVSVIGKNNNNNSRTKKGQNEQQLEILPSHFVSRKDKREREEISINSHATEESKRSLIKKCTMLYFVFIVDICTTSGLL